MVVDRLPGGVREFASYLDGLLARLDQGGGWSGVFWQRDPDGMRACLDGREVPPWDVVEALLEDLAAAYGSAAAAAERERARALYRAALTAYDARPGARDTLLDRLDVMLREQRYAAERHSELTRLLSAASAPEDADSLRLDLAWAQDDHDRATARCAELRSRLAELDRRAAVRSRGVRQGARPGRRGPRAAGARRRRPAFARPGAMAGRWRGSGGGPGVRVGCGSGTSPGRRGTRARTWRYGGAARRRRPRRPCGTPAVITPGARPSPRTARRPDRSPGLRALSQARRVAPTAALSGRPTTPRATSHQAEHPCPTTAPLPPTPRTRPR
ncbi:hypothetical protein [Streptomyces puniciscabiei]|uniref:hypothetical protein n=1 Tax=Streptomyces puniciscabiei TaxID=164348 RepID=UPI003EBA24BD